MGGPAMNPWWIALPMALMAAVPIWTEPTLPIVVIETAGCIFCILGILNSMLGPVTAGCVTAAIGYALALWSAGPGVDMVGAALFGLGLLFLLDLSEFVRRFRGADVSRDVLRAQTAYWLGRAAVIAGAVAALTAGGFVLSLLVPGTARAVVAGIGAILAFAGALKAGIVRRPGDT
jgi:hypothetical protein